MKGFAEETGLPVTLVATSAGAYEGNKMYNIAEEARLQGMEIRPQIAGRPDRRPAWSAIELPRLHAPPDLRKRTQAIAAR